MGKKTSEDVVFAIHSVFKKLKIAVTDVPVPSDPIWKTCSSLLEKDGLIFSPQSLYVRAMKKTEVENI